MGNCGGAGFRRHSCGYSKSSGDILVRDEFVVVSREWL